MTTLLKSLLILVPLGLIMLSASASAATWSSGPGRLILAANYVPMAEAVSKARKSTNGRVLSSRLKERDGRQVYVVKILMPGGKVRRVVVDAVSGNVIHR